MVSSMARVSAGNCKTTREETKPDQGLKREAGATLKGSEVSVEA